MLGLGFNPVKTKTCWSSTLGTETFSRSTRRPVRPAVFMNPIAGSGLNALTFDKAGNVYVSDSFNGIIWKTDTQAAAPNAMEQRSAARAGNAVYYTAFRREWHRVQQCRHDPVRGQHRVSSDHPDPGDADGTGGSASIFITGINAPDGIAIDRDDNLWVCANQEDEIVVIDTTGKVIAKLGDFNGIDPKGFPRGLLFPASLAFSNDRSTLYVSNLTLFLPYARSPRRRSTRPGRSRLAATPCLSFTPKSRRSPTTMSNRLLRPLTK